MSARDDLALAREDEIRSRARSGRAALCREKVGRKSPWKALRNKYGKKHACDRSGSTCLRYLPLLAVSSVLVASSCCQQ
eukprot:scaffold7095_cov260-Pinguiococcus_pyrenoidosus.AAC.7